MRVLSAAPLISKFRNKQFARKRVRHSSIISTLSGMRKGKGEGTWYFWVAWRVCWTAETGVEGQEGEVADFPGVCFRQEGRVICLYKD
jgi:hypothetical protein